MKKSLLITISRFVFVAMLLLTLQSNGQMFTENIGSGTGTQSIAATTFQNTGFTFSGTADTRDSGVSSGYTGASGGKNVFITSTVGRDIVISGINTSSYNSLVLSFGHFKSTTAGNNELVVEVSSNGTTYTPLTYSRATGTGTSNWTLVTASGTIPSTSNLYIRFRQTSTATQFRIDDIKLTGTLISGPTISPSTTSLTTYGNVNVGSNSTSKNFTVSGTDLTNDVTVAASADYEVSLDNSAFSSGFTLTQSGGTLVGQPVTIYVRYSPTSTGINNGAITLMSTGATTKTITVSGTGVVPTPVITPSVTSLSSFGNVNNGSNSASQNFTVSAAALTNNVTVTASTDYEVSLDDSAFSSGFTLTQSGGTLVGQPVTIYVRFSPTSVGLNNGQISLMSTGAVTKTISMNGTGIVPVIDAPMANAASSVTATSFIANWSTVAGATNYRLDVSKNMTFIASVPTADLFISEYIEGSSSNKYIEIYNGTGNSVDLSNYELRLFSNGSSTPTTSNVLTGMLANNTTIVYKNPSANAYLGTAIDDSAVNFNGDDAIALYKLSITSYVDIFGSIGFDPGSAWTTGGNTTVNKTLVRNSNITSGLTSNPTTDFPTLGTEWTEFNIDDVSHLGSHMYTVNNPSFVIGYEDLTVNTNSQLVSGLEENTTYHFRVRAFDGTTSANSNVISVTTLIQQPTFTAISQDVQVCQNTTAFFTITGLLPNSISNIGYNINGGTTQYFMNVSSDPSGNASVSLVLSAANNGQNLTIVSVERVDLPTTTLTTSYSIALSVQLYVTYYADSDEDGFGNDSDTLQSCSPLLGYVLVGGDCDDTDDTIYPGATEICFDGILQNCNGTLTDGCPPVLVNMISAYCGVTLPYIFSTVGAYQPILPAGTSETGYLFEITNLSNFETRFLERPIRNFKLTMTDIYEYSTTYLVRVAVRVNDEWQPYGDNCFFNTPSIPTTQVISSTCGTTLPLIASSIGCNSVNSANLYRFRVVNAANTSEVQTIEGTNRFRLTDLTEYPVQYNTTYNVSVQVRVVIDGAVVWSNYGSSCLITTPKFPTTQVTLAQCELIASSMSEVIYIDNSPNATVNKIRLTNTSLGYSQTVDRTDRNFTLSMFTGLQAATTYTVAVSIQLNGVFGPYGKNCSITTPGALTRPVRAINNSTKEFSVIAFPNPFTNTFALDVKTSSVSDVNVSVYDMTGRLLEVRTAKAEDLLEFNLGDRYPSGVYNIVVNQGLEVKTVRVVKQ